MQKVAMVPLLKNHPDCRFCCLDFHSTSVRIAVSFEMSLRLQRLSCFLLMLLGDPDEPPIGSNTCRLARQGSSLEEMRWCNESGRVG